MASPVTRCLRRSGPRARCARCCRPASACCRSARAISARAYVTATRDLLASHAGAILVNADSPTLPAAILRAAVDATRRGGAVVLSPALDGGYTLIGVSRLHERLYQDIPWSTAEVHQKTVERAAEIALPVVNACPAGTMWMTPPRWRSLEAELAGEPPAFAAVGSQARQRPPPAHISRRAPAHARRVGAVTAVPAETPV